MFRTVSFMIVLNRIFIETIRSIAFVFHRLLEMMIEENASVEFAVEATIILGSLARGFVFDCYFFVIKLLPFSILYLDLMILSYIIMKSISLV